MNALLKQIYFRFKNGNNTISTNFIETIPDTKQALKTIRMFKDEYILDYINAEGIEELPGGTEELWGGVLGKC